MDRLFATDIDDAGAIAATQSAIPVSFDATASACGLDGTAEAGEITERFGHV